jgi:hypothetical protein
VSGHYTAVLSIEHASITEKDGGYNKPKIQERVVKDVAKIIVRADTVEKLRDKLASHVALIEE